MRKIIAFLSVCLPLLAVSAPSAPAPAPRFVEGVAYRTVATPTPRTGNTIQVVEFFNYGCPWCYHAEPAIRQFETHLPKDVAFHRVAVAFNPRWELYAKAYYVGEALGKEPVITPAFFKALHDDKQSLDTEASIQALFQANGVSESDFKTAFHFSPGLAMKLQASKEGVTQYQISGVPTIVVDGKYLTHSLYAQGDANRLIDITRFLIEKARKEKKPA